jgi:hypothetical protein
MTRSPVQLRLRAIVVLPSSRPSQLCSGCRGRFLLYKPSLLHMGFDLPVMLGLGWKWAFISLHVVLTRSWGRRKRSVSSTDRWFIVVLRVA